MRYAGPLTPGQAAAFWKLGMLTGDDLSRLAMQWLEEGVPAESVAVLASEPDVTLRDNGALFERCLREAGVTIPGEREASWIFIQTLLKAVELGFDPLDAVYCALQLDSRGAVLFSRRDLAPRRMPFAAESIAFENLAGLYWELHDDEVPPEKVDEAMRAMKLECARVLAEFYIDPKTLDG